jgi:hypothetical protein
LQSKRPNLSISTVLSLSVRVDSTSFIFRIYFEDSITCRFRWRSQWQCLPKSPQTDSLHRPPPLLVKR